MHGTIQAAADQTISHGDKSVVGKSPDDKSVADAEQWFSALARSLHAAKPGTVLHYTTGFDERSCQRYAAGAVQPPGFFIRALLRSEDGAQWLAALMDGSDAKWWREHQRDLQRIAVAQRAKQILSEMP